MPDAEAFANSTSVNVCQYREPAGFLTSIRIFLGLSFAPICALVGLCSSFLIIVCMPYTKVSRKQKMYYVSVSCFGALALISQQLFNLFVVSVHHYLPHMRQNLLPSAMQLATCLFSFFAAYCSEFIVAYLLGLLAFERMVTLQFPMKSRNCTPKRNLVAIACVITAAICVNLFLFYTFVPYSYSYEQVCLPSAHSAARLLTVTTVDIHVPNFLLVLLCCAVLIMLFANKKQQDKDSASLPAFRKGRSCFSGATIIMLYVSVIRFALFCPSFLLYAAFLLGSYGKDDVDDFTLLYASEIAMSLTGLSACFNLLVYWRRLADFRVRVCRFVKCKAWYYI